MISPKVNGVNEVNLGLERRRRQDTDAVVLIMYRQIDSKHMTSGLRALLNTTPHLIFTEGLGERDSMTYSNGMSFSTKDRDNDLWSPNCAVNRYGAWWYNSCIFANLNGQYAKGESYNIYRKGATMCQYYKKNSVAKCRKLHYIPILKKSITTLELRLCDLPNIRRQTFQNISSYKIIRLAFTLNNSIQSISTDAFSDLRYLQTLEVLYERQLDVFHLKSSLGSLNVTLFSELILESNGWTSLPDNLLDNLGGVTLSVLSLNGNDIRIMNASIFSPIFGLKKFSCIGCAMEYFNANGLQNVESIDLTALILYRCHINLKNFLYFARVHHRIKKGYVKLTSCDDFDFDAFVVYCDSDRQWVHRDLIKRLEDKGLKICFHHRDFEVGEPIINNIEKFMNKSWKIIVVMSNDFAKSEWCQWEVNLALERRRRQGTDALVLIMYRQIDSKHMTSGLRTLLNTTPHLIFTEGLGERMFWNALVNCINKSMMLPPTAIL
ncbi:unnamed protein product [Mytilus edulis]|uniref:TIR domain-containing protein n=1 Tax=Mytilus edulis TaxID=6550 RepID=A0A8S3SFL4_MYTED|nr:unnamed protein product [Mytilus edulis]